MGCKLGISSMSLGWPSAGHSLEHRLDMAKKYGFQGIELAHQEILFIAEHWKPDNGRNHQSDDEPTAAEIVAARRVRQLCQDRGLEIICLQSFTHYDGLIDRTAHARRFSTLVQWMRLAHELGTDMVQIPSNFLGPEHVSDDLDLIVDDLRRAADLALQQQPPIRLAYESLCWSTRVDIWERCWQVVQRVDRPNFGMCLDTFNIAGRIFADPTSATGRTPDADEALRRSVARLVAGDVDVRKVFYVQVVDAERMREPLVQGHAYYDGAQPARMSWSRNCRLFYGEADRGAYLPVRDIAWAILRGLGFRGWVSMELFHRRMSERSPEVPEELARRGALSWARLVKDMQLSTESSNRPHIGSP
ncbi:hypothetical protein VTK73DRAFT_9628 [Phialemonium thermophilum]|uniref:Xylose isomerase-like TIM barrel domain-containing protein n=1 Tax=Phialemonium thermophilum TaxID=223376 RepID=A0ABR3XJP2_9PEZI